MGSETEPVKLLKEGFRIKLGEEVKDPDPNAQDGTDYLYNLFYRVPKTIATTAFSKKLGRVVIVWDPEHIDLAK